MPEERIAQYPLGARDLSKLLVWKNHIASEAGFRDLPDLLPPGSLLVFNDTRVVRARLLFRRPTGSVTEIFILDPAEPVALLPDAFRVTGRCTWKCLIGKGRRWKEQVLEKKLHVGNETVILNAFHLEESGDGCSFVRFTWEPAGVTFLDILDNAGAVPLPPYITREADREDTDRYQTIYARYEGSVAAPTAGLHFTEEVLERLRRENHGLINVTLHVGLGTFRPVSSPVIREHVMHEERFTVSINALQKLLHQIDHPVVAVGTTAARTLESLYWTGHRLLTDKTGPETNLPQWYPYRNHEFTEPRRSLEALLKWMETNSRKEIQGKTGLIIVPGYSFRIIRGLITNFHQPRSTLLLLVSAWTGPDWKEAYRFALENNFRFLSYGDACLFLTD